MQLITQAEFDAAAQEDPYFRNRWGYYSEIIALIGGLEPQPETCLEIGAYKLPVFRDSDTLDRSRHLSDVTYQHDATRVPWPVDRRYDLAIALQVWEHLGDRQAEAFSELRRVASRAIMSFPLAWDTPDNATHHNITEERIQTWVHGIEPTYRAVTGRPGRERLIYLLELDGHGAPAVAPAEEANELRQHNERLQAQLVESRQAFVLAERTVAAVVAGAREDAKSLRRVGEDGAPGPWAPALLQAASLP